MTEAAAILFFAIILMTIEELRIASLKTKLERAEASLAKAQANDNRDPKTGRFVRA